MPVVALLKKPFQRRQVYADYRELLARPDIDVVDIVVPSYLHHEIASAALAAGKHLLLEKPMALSLRECDDLIALAAKHKRVFAVGHELRLSSLWGKVKELIAGGFIGEPKYALVELSRRPYRLGSENWRYDISRVGSWILEEPIHFFDLARWYLSSLGDPQTVYATANSRQAGHEELKDNFSAIVHFPRGGYAVVSQTLAAFEHHQTVKVTGTKGALWASWSGAMDRTLHPTFSLRAFDGETGSRNPDRQDHRRSLRTGRSNGDAGSRDSREVASFRAAPPMAAGRWPCVWRPKSRSNLASRLRSTAAQ